MSGLIAIVGGHAPNLNPAAILECISPLGILDTESVQSDVLTLIVGQHRQAPCRDVCFIDNDKFAAALAGDVVEHQDIDWFGIRGSLLDGKPRLQFLKRLRGAFALTVFDKERRSLFVITDPFAWQPVFMSATDDGAVVSTSLATFLKTATTPLPVDDDWLYEFMYFNYGVGPTTPLEGVRRLPAATVSRYDLDSGRISQWKYRDKPQAPTSLLAGTEAVTEAIDQFNAIVPDYFPPDTSITMGLSAGLDCRAVLAAAPDRALDGLHSFTFGMPESSEFVECDDIAVRLGFRHLPVPLGNEFLQQLPRLSRDTVFLSGGLQNVNRSHLLFVYSKLQHDGGLFSLMLTGVSGDHIFRDHIKGRGNVPHIISADMAAQYREGRHRLDPALYKGMFGKRFTDFEMRIEMSLDGVAEEYGEFGDPHAYLSYLMYEAGPHYFGGQLAIANSFSTFRTPYWDPDIVGLGYRLQDATLGFSASMNRKDEYRETRIQAEIVAASARIGQLPYRDLPVKAYANGNKYAFQLYRGLRKLRTAYGRRRFAYGEDWPLWYRTVMNDEIHRLLGDDSRLRDYLTAEFIETAIAESDVHWLGKLITAEHTLRFIENRWQRVADSQGM